MFSVNIAPKRATRATPASDTSSSRPSSTAEIAAFKKKLIDNTKKYMQQLDKTRNDEYAKVLEELRAEKALVEEARKAAEEARKATNKERRIEVST